jgi:RHS repeat-associated protein
MATPSNLSEQILALPSGAGAVQSAGQTFAVRPYSGTGSYTIPIETKPGHAGIAPALALSYSTHAGSGIAGLGWSLDLAAVERRTDKGLPSFDDQADTFALQQDELLAVGGGNYRLRIEGRFARIRHVRETGRDFWVVTERDGTRVFYGLEPDQRLHDGAGRIGAWYVSKKQDANGNEVLFSYTRDAATSDVRLAAVHWAGCYRVSLRYEPRPDPIRSNRAGFEHRQEHRLAQIDVEARPRPDTEYHAYRTYTLVYAQSALTGRSLLAEVAVVGTNPDGERRALPSLRFGYTQPELADRTWHTLGGALPGGSLADRTLTLVRQSGSGLPDLLETSGTGHWLRENLGGGLFGTPKRVAAPAQAGLDADGTFLSDMDGDGFADLVIDGGARVYRGLAGGGWGAPYTATAAPGVGLASPGVRLADLNADGLPHALQAGTGSWVFFKNQGEGRWAPGTAVLNPPPLRLDDPRVHLADLDGDGLPDLVFMEGNRVRVWPGKGWGRFGGPYELHNPPNFGPTFDPRAVRWADLSGSGQADLLYLRAGTAVVCFNQAGVALADAVTLPTMPQSSNGHIEPVDLFGAGAAGLLFTDYQERPGAWRFLELFVGRKPDLLNRIENGLGATTTIEYTSSAAHWLDDKHAGNPWRTAMPSPQVVVAAITTADAVTGNRIGIRYRYHHGVYDGAEREFRGFAMVEQIDREANPDDPAPLAQVLVKRWYHTGFDLDLRDEYTPLPEGALADQIPALPWALRSLRGRLKREETFALDGNPRPYGVQETAYRVFPIQRRPGTQQHSFAPLPVMARMTHLERGDERRIVETTTRYDRHYGSGYGLPIEVREKGYGRRGVFTSAHELAQTNDLERVTVTRYLNLDRPDGASFDTSYTPAYLVGKPAQVERYGVTADEPALLARERFFYDGEAYKGLGYPGTATTAGLTHGRLSCKLVLAFTDDLLAQTYPAGSGARAQFDAAGNYLTDGAEHFIHTERYRYDQHGMVTGALDPNGNQSHVEYDEQYGLFPTLYRDAAGLPTRLTHGELPFQVTAIRDANGNTTGFTYDPSGLPRSKSVQGTFDGQDWSGDPPSHPSEAYAYEFDTNPVSVLVRTRQERLGATFDVVRYIDGLGRTVQERHTAEEDPNASGARYRVTGRQVFNHKGLVVESHQPFFAATADYGEGDTTTTVVRTSYDPLGRAVRVDYPDGTFETTSYHPWVRTVADRNDHAGQIGPADPRYGRMLDRFAHHRDTPTRTFVDALGRAIAVAEDNGGELHVTRTLLDLQDHTLDVWDARDLPEPTWSFSYDLSGRTIASRHATALGEHYALSDAAGNPIWSRDARGIEVTRSFDALNRPLAETTHIESGTKLRRRWRYVEYDETAADFADQQERNLFGKTVEEHDAAGMRSFEYDWRGLVTKTSHRFWSQQDTAGRAWDDPASQLWTDGASYDPPIPAGDEALPALLELPGLTDATTLAVETSYDAAGRPLEVRYPGGLGTRNRYNAAGLLERVEVDRGSGYQVVVEALGYNARGQLAYLKHGNGVETRHEYDRELERLARIITRRVAASTTSFQDRSYAYDPVGNPMQITDNLVRAAFAHNQLIPNTRTFEYDPRYRLIQATGKKHRMVNQKDADVLVPAPDRNDYEPYTMHYEYDAVGNFSRNQEYSGGGLHYKRGRLDLFNGDSVEAASFDAPGEGNFRYDANGNTTHTPRHEELAYSDDNQVRYANLGGGGQVRYFRHGDQRVLRLVRKNGITGLSVYLGEFEYHLRDAAAGSTKLVLQVHGHGRHAQAERVLAGSDPDSLPLFFSHPDHLQSAHVLTTEDGDLLSQEEFFAYGRPSDRRDARNRYRFIGVERDEHTQLCMTGPRTYDPVCGRFLQGDPLAKNHVERMPMSYPPAPLLVTDRSGYDIELLIGTSYTDPENGAVERYGHTAIRVFGDGYDYTYDFGRYGDTTGEFKAQGEGILRRWEDFDRYIKLQNSKGTASHYRTTTGYRFPTHPTQDKVVINFYDQHIQKATLQGSKPGVASRYKLQNDYHGLLNNCTTQSVDAFEKAVPRYDLDVGKEIVGRGLTDNEKTAATVRNLGWPTEVFTPEDLRAVLDQLAASDPSVTVEEWSRQTGTTPQVTRQGVENHAPPEWYPAMGTQPVPTE